MSLGMSIAGVERYFIEQYSHNPIKRLDKLLKKQGIGWKTDRRYYDFLKFLASKFIIDMIY